MFDAKSRYASCEKALLSQTGPDGATQIIPYIRRRRIAPAESSPTVLEHTVRQGERLDSISARYLGDPAEYWRLCDANGVADPSELEVIGRVIKIPIPGL